MKLTTKLVSVILASFLVLLGIDLYVGLQHEVGEMQGDFERDAATLGETLRWPVVEAWNQGGEPAAMKVLAGANRNSAPVRVRWVWLDDEDEQRRPAAPSAAVRAFGEQGAASARDAAFYYTYIPIRVADTRHGGLELIEPLDQLDARLESAVVQRAILFAATALVGIVIALLLGRRLVGGRLAALVEKTRRVGAGDLGGPVALEGADELTELADSLNAMCSSLTEARTRIANETAARVAALEQLRHADRLASLGQLAAGIAHELGTPLNVVSARANLIAAGRLEGEAIGSNARIIKEQTQRMTGIIERVLGFARKRPAELGPAEVGELVRETVELVAADARKGGVELSIVGASGPVRLHMDSEQMRQVLLNLVMNALQATPEGGRVRVELRTGSATPPAGYRGEAGEYVLITVSDTGSGIEPEHLSRVFEPFFTTKDVGTGTGLGLSVAHGIVAEHDGWLDVSSEPGKGATFTVHLPLREAS